MLFNLKDLEKFTIGANDGTIGRVKDCYFDDDVWVIRYLIVDTSAWLPGRKILISPFSIGGFDWESKVLPVSISKEQIRHSPNIDTNKPVSRQSESNYLGFYGYPTYWNGLGVWGPGAFPAFPSSGVGYAGSAVAAARSAPDQDRVADEDHHLRSCEMVNGYQIHATDGDIGKVQGFLIDDRSWAIQYLIVNTSNWWLGHQVLIAPEWTEEVSWPLATIKVNLTRDAIKSAPVYKPGITLTRDAEAAIHNHYDRTGYWQNPAKRKVA